MAAIVPADGPNHGRTVTVCCGYSMTPADEDPAQSDEDLAASWEAALAAEGEDKDEEENDDAAAWEAALAAENGGGDNDTARVLSQDEINNLLGDDTVESINERLTGVERLLHSGLVSYERLPMLEVVLDRMVRIFSSSLRRLTGENVEVSFEQIKSLRFGEYMNGLPLPCMLGVFKAQEWDNLGLVTVDGPAIYTLVDVLLGGRASDTARIEGRPYTSIERMLVERVLRILLGDVSSAFDPVSHVTFDFERLETNPNFASISRKSNACIAAKIYIDINGRGGFIEILFTYAMLEPVREVLLQHFMGEKFGRDSIWETHLANELWQTDIDLDVILHEQSMRLGDLVNLDVGSTIILNGASSEAVEVRCGSKRLFQAKVGRKGNHVAAKIDQSFINEASLALAESF